MTQFVLDSSVAIKWVLPETDSDRALALRADYQQKTHELIAPDIFAVEVGHALTRSERRGVLSVGEAHLAFTDVITYAPILHSHLPLLPRAIELSSQTRVGVYDCLYLALAEREQCVFVTADKKLVKTMSGYPIMSLSSL